MAEFDMHEALHDAQMLAEKRHSEIMRLRRVNYDLIAALEDIATHRERVDPIAGALPTDTPDKLRNIARAAIATAKGELAQ